MTDAIDGRIVALVPAFERADSVGATVMALRGLADVDEVVVIDDGSRDATGDAAQGSGARVVRLRANVGKGGAVAAGVAASADATVYLLLDADVGATAGAARALLDPLLAGDADMTIGVLPSAGGRGGFGVVRRLSRWGIRRACGFVAEAPLSGQRAVRAELLRSLEPAARFGLEVAMTIDAVRQGARVVEVPVTMDHRHTGRRLSGFAHRGRQGADIVRALWPRLTSSRTRMLALLLAVIATFGAVGWSGARWEPATTRAPGGASKVVIVGVNGLAWSDIGTGLMPNLDRLIAHGAVGAMSLRSASPRPDVASAYATLGAGRRVDARDDGAQGALGSALHAAGLRTAVVTRAGTGAAAALADEAGLVDASEVVAEGDLEGLVAATNRGVAAADVVLVDVDAFDRRAVDQVVGRLSRAPDALLLVASVVPPGREWGLGPVIVGGAGVVRGYLQSASTKRLGLVALTDLAPAVLSAVDVRVPSGMVGHSLRYHRATPEPTRLARLDRDSSYREGVYHRVTFGYVVLQVLLYLFAVFAIARRGGPGALRPVLRVAVVALAAWPLATYVFRAIPGAAALGPLSLALLLLLDVVLASLALRSRLRPLGPLVWVIGATAWLLIIDVATGARLQVASIMGYSPQDGGRFFGIGNVAFAILTVTSILTACFHLERAPRRREAYVATGAFLALVVVIDGAPCLGNDVGGILTLVPVLGLMLYCLSGRRLTWRAAATAGIATVAIVAGAATVDVLRPAGAPSHLGNFVSDLISGNASRSTATIARKLRASLDVLRITGAWCLPVGAGLLLHLLVQGRRMTDLLPLHSPRRAGVVAALVAGLVGAALNDSSVVITAMVLAYLAPVVTLLALEREGVDRSATART